MSRRRSKRGTRSIAGIAKPSAAISRPYARPANTETDCENFAATLNHFGIEHAARMRAYVEVELDHWLREAPKDIRAEALSLVSNRIIRVRLRAGLEPFDDPLPDQPDRLFQTIRKLLA